MTDRTAGKHVVDDAPLSEALVSEVGAPDAPACASTDVLVAGTVFFDIVLAGMENGPVPGAEIRAEGMASCPGGIANFAVAARRLGLRTSLAAVFGDDDYGDFCWRTLEEQEGIDLHLSRRASGWHSPVTVSMSFDGDRAMVTHAHEPPFDADELIIDPVRTACVMVDLAKTFDHERAEVVWPQWVSRARDDGALVFADVGWDGTGEWPAGVLDALDGCFAFAPNAAEAMAYTRTDSPRAALYALADRVPLAVVTNGAHGVLAIDAASDQEVFVPGLGVAAIDPTGAGDVFGAALVAGTLAELPIADRIALANLCAALAVGHFGGSLAAPGWGDVNDWWHELNRVHSPTTRQRLQLRRYEFLDDFASQQSLAVNRRASATIACRLDSEAPSR